MRYRSMTPEEEESFLKSYGLEPLPQEELDRREAAAQRLYEALLKSDNPYYRKRAEKEGIEFARALHSHQVLSD